MTTTRPSTTGNKKAEQRKAPLFDVNELLTGPNFSDDCSYFIDYPHISPETLYENVTVDDGGLAAVEDMEAVGEGLLRAC